MGFFLILKFCVIIGLMLWVLWALRQLPYNQYRTKNIAARLQVIRARRAERGWVLIWAHRPALGVLAAGSGTIEGHPC